MNASSSSPATTTGRRRQWQEAARWGVRGAFLLAAAAALLRVWGPPSVSALAVAASPFVVLGALLATHAVPAVAWAGFVVLALDVVSRRWFCRWACPLGLCADSASQLGKRCGRRRPRLPAVGQWIALFTLGGAGLGYPGLLWLDPLALFSSPFTIRTGGLSAAAACGAAGAAVILTASLLWPDVWCARLCPLGALQDVSTLVASPLRRLFFRSGRSLPAAPARLARRGVLAAAAGLACAALVRRTSHAQSRPLRPPGALDESRFWGLCVRCGNCQRACPARIITPDLGRQGVAAFLTPVVRFDKDYCREDCTRCMDVCPSGALARHSQHDKRQAAIGLAHVDMEHCLLSDDRECSACRNYCPFDAIRIAFSEESYTLTVRVDAQRCPGCGACEVACPTSPVKAIVVRPSAQPARSASCSSRAAVAMVL